MSTPGPYDPTLPAYDPNSPTLLPARKPPPAWWLLAMATIIALMVLCGEVYVSQHPAWRATLKTSLGLQPKPPDAHIVWIAHAGDENLVMGYLVNTGATVIRKPRIWIEAGPKQDRGFALPGTISYAYISWDPGKSGLAPGASVTFSEWDVPAQFPMPLRVTDGKRELTVTQEINGDGDMKFGATR